MNTAAVWSVLYTEQNSEGGWGPVLQIVYRVVHIVSEVDDTDDDDVDDDELERWKTICKPSLVM